MNKILAFVFAPVPPKAMLGVVTWNVDLYCDASKAVLANRVEVESLVVIKFDNGIESSKMCILSMHSASFDLKYDAVLCASDSLFY
jgi:hypothetical protein